MGYCFVPIGTELPWTEEKRGFCCSNEGWRRLLQMAYVGGWKSRYNTKDWHDPIGGIEWAYEYHFESMGAIEVKEFATALKTALPELDNLNSERATKIEKSFVQKIINFLEGTGANGIEWS